MADSTPHLAAHPASGAGPRSSLDRVVKALESRGLPTRNYRPDSFMAGCPVHEDSTPSLHVNWRKGQRGGGVLLFCHGCQAGAGQLVEALGLSLADLFDEPLPERDRGFGRVGKSPNRRLAAQRRGKLGRLPGLLTGSAGTSEPEPQHSWVEIERYPYRDLGGGLVEEVIREECTAEGSRHKRFRQVFFTAGGRELKRKPQDFYPVLYRAPEVAQAVQAGRQVWLLEGEKDVHTAEGLGVVATTNAQGGKSFPDELVDCLEGADVVVVLDRDATGWARGVDLHSKLSGVRARVRLALPGVDRPKADLTDHVEAGLNLQALLDVSIEEVSTWHALSAVQDKAKSLQQAVTEAQARWSLAEDGVDVDTNRRFARRWTLEAQIRHEALQNAVDQVYGHGMRVGTVWAGEAMEHADQMLAEATDLAARCHLDLGVPVPPTLRPATPPFAEAPASPVDEPARARAAGPRSSADFVADTDSFTADKGAGATAPVFRVLGGQIVQWEADRSARKRNEDWDEDEGQEGGKLKVLLSTVVRVTVREYLEVEDHDDLEQTELLGRSGSLRKRVTAPRTLIAVRMQFPDPGTGEIMEIRIAADQWRDHTWLESLPGHPDYDHKRAGLDQLQRAILAISDDVQDEVLYRATGWRETPDGRHRYIHRRGAISGAGHEDVEVAFSGPIERYDLPDPVRDPRVLREAWLGASVAMLDRLPARVSAPLLGQVFRAVLGHNPWVLTLVGPPGSYKTSVAAKAMQHFGERWEHTKPASSMSGNGDTFNALRYKLHNAKDALYWMDDFAPTKSWLEAQKHLEETARLVHNQEERSRSSRDGLSISDGTGPRASGLCTSEVMPRPGSGAERMLVVPIAREDVTPALLFPLDEPLSRHGRAVVMASYISWLAGDLKALRTKYMGVADAYADRLVDSGETVRQATAVAHTWIGWVAMTDFLVQASAITPEEREQTLRRVDAALREAGRAAVNPDMPRTTGARVRELLAYALRQGIAYVDDVKTGDNPPWPMASRLGWQRTVTDVDGMGAPSRYRLERVRSATRLGYVLHDPDHRDRGRVLMCDSTQLEAVLKAASSTQTEKLEIDRNTACRALHEEGVLIADESEGRTRHTVKCRIPVENRTARMVTLHLDRIIGDDGEEDPDTADDSGPSGQGSDPQPEVPGLTPADPTRLDTWKSSEHAGIVASDHSDDHDGPDQPDEEESSMRRLSDGFVSRSWTDRDGVVGWTEPCELGNEGPCVVCGRRCGVFISGVHTHLTCWERSTVAERSAPKVTATAAAVQPPAEQQPHVAPPAISTTLPRRGAAASGESFRAAAAVVDTDGIWCSNGEHLPLPEVPRHVGDLVQLAQRLRLGTQVTKYLPASGQVWVTAALARRMGIDVAAIEAADGPDRDKVAREVSKGSPAVTAALAAGYSIGGDGDGLGRWSRVWRGAEKSVWVVLLPAMSRDEADVALMAGDPDPATLARRIGLFADTFGFPYQLSGATTGLDLMQALRWKDRDRLFGVREPISPALMNAEADLSWCRPPTDEERQHKWVHAYDRSGSYLAGVSGLELGIGEPLHHPEGTTFTPRIPGYWRIEVPEVGDWRMPHPLDPRSNTVGKVRWLTTPGLEFAYEQGYEPRILEAYTWAEHARILDPWYEKIRDARSGLDNEDPDSQVARDQLKQVYAATIGMLGSHTHMAGRSGYAPDRRHHIVAKARTNILRRVAKIGEETGRYPVAIVLDTVLYTSDEADPAKAWPGGERWFGRDLGRYKVEASALLESQLPFLTGGAYRGKDVLVGRARGKAD